MEPRSKELLSARQQVPAAERQPPPWWNSNAPPSPQASQSRRKVKVKSLRGDKNRSFFECLCSSKASSCHLLWAGAFQCLMLWMTWTLRRTRLLKNAAKGGSGGVPRLSAKLSVDVELWKGVICAPGLDFTGPRTVRSRAVANITIFLNWDYFS